MELLGRGAEVRWLPFPWARLERGEGDLVGMSPEAVVTSDQWLLSAQPWPHTQIVRLFDAAAS